MPNEPQLYDQKWWFYSKQIGTWVGAACYYAWGVLDAHWPADKREWVLFWLQLIPFVFGAGVAKHMANRLPK